MTATPHIATGTWRIARERQRQMEQEGYTPGHDDEHERGELVAAAVCYARCALTITAPDSSHAAAPMSEPPADWPWLTKEWKPSWSDPIKNLVRAGALLSAEIDRLARKEARGAAS